MIQLLVSSATLLTFGGIAYILGQVEKWPLWSMLCS